MAGISVWGRVAYLWTRAVGTGGLLVAAIATFVGPNMWNLGRIIAAGMALVCLPVTAVLARDAAVPDRPGTSRPAVPVFAAAALAAFLVLAAVWFTAGLLGWLRVANPVPLQDVLRWLAIPLAMLAAGATVGLSGEGAGLPRWRRGWLFVDLLAQACAAASGIMVVAAPFELVGADVRAFLVAVFAVSLPVHVLFVVADARERAAVADAGLARAVRRGRPGGTRGGLSGPASRGAGLALAAVALALAVPGWAGPIGGGLVGQVALCLVATGYDRW